MHSKTWTRNIALALLAALAMIPIQLAAQDKQDHHHAYHHYQLIDAGTFGGPQSFLSSGFDINAVADVNQRGALVGWADTPIPDPFYPNCFTTDCYVAHAFRLQNGVTTDLGVLAHGFSSDAGAGHSDGGLIAGAAQNGQIDPLIPGFPELRAVLWENGIIQDLGTLSGGYESYSSGINNRGHVVGVASNAIPDANSMSFPGYQARAFLWDKQQGMQDLGTLSGGTDAIAAMINQPGQVIGWSYTSSAPNANCVNGWTLAVGSFIWDKKNGMKDLGGFGGTCTLAADLNTRGQVVGTSNLTGDQDFHAFVWDRATGIIDLGTLGGSISEARAINEKGETVGGSKLLGHQFENAVLWRKTGGEWEATNLGTVNGSNCSFAFSINTSGQIVGTSGTNCSLAFLRENGGPMVDLNSLLSSNSVLYVNGPHTINNLGEIAASGVDTNGNNHALLLIPCDESHTGIKGCDYSLVEASAAPQNHSPRDFPGETPLSPLSRRGNLYHFTILQGETGGGHSRTNSGAGLKETNMKSRMLTWITANLLAVLAIPIGLAAQGNHDNHKHHHYKLIDTGTLGGASSSLGFEGERDINSRGTVVSLAETQIPDPFAPNCFFADCFVGHAVDWRDSVLTDLSALPSVNNSGPIWISDSGLVGGVSQNGSIDPLTGSPEFQAVLFKDGSVVDLGTLGGNESSAFGVNDRGQVVGCAANAVSDPFGFCFGVPQQSRAFIWQGGGMKDLGTLGGPDALAELVNGRGQVAGWSLTDSTVNPATGIPTQHPFLWEKGKMRDLGTIGGTAVYLINNLNNRGQIVGGMNVVGDQSFHPFLWDGVSLRDLGTFGGDFGSGDWINEAGDVVGWALTAGNQASHAFLWRKGVLTDLGTVDGDPSSSAFVVNSERQVVGATQDNNFAYVHAFLWERGSIADLNALIPDDSGVQLMAAVGLNERGEIVAQGVLSNGDLHAFLLIPCDENHSGVEGCDYSLVDAGAAAVGTSQENIAQRAVTRNADVTSPSETRDQARLGHVRQHRFFNLASSNN